jgi:hypothetical protein
MAKNTKFQLAEYKSPEELLALKVKFHSNTKSDENGYYMSYYTAGENVYCTIFKLN